MIRIGEVRKKRERGGRVRFPTSFVAFIVAAFAAMTPAAAANCENYAVSGSNCVRTVFLGWGTAGGGTQSVITLLSGLSASAPVTYAITKLSSSKGTSYSGYFGINAGLNGAAPSPVTASSFASVSVAPGSGAQVAVSQTCFDATCTVAPPAAFTGPYLSNMFSIMLTITASSGADLDVTPLPLLTIQFLNASGLVNFQEQEQAVDVTAVKTASTAIADEGATPASRYVYNSAGAVSQPFTVFSVTNPSTTATVTASISVYGENNNIVATVALPTLAPLGAAGFLLVGRSPGDTLGLLPSSTILPAGPDGIFHGTINVANASGPIVFLSQEFFGDSMLNAFIIQ